MTEQAKAARREYKRAWAAANPDKVRAQQERYWQRRAQQAQQAEEARQEPDRHQAEGAQDDL